MSRYIEMAHRPCPLEPALAKTARQSPLVLERVKLPTAPLVVARKADLAAPLVLATPHI